VAAPEVTSILPSRWLVIPILRSGRTWRLLCLHGLSRHTNEEVIESVRISDATAHL
jgi:hypothetical protein